MTLQEYQKEKQQHSRCSALPTRLRRASKRVSFSLSGDSVLATVAACASMTESERDEVWYRQSELDSFKDEARDLSRRLRSGVNTVISSHVIAPQQAQAHAQQDRQWHTMQGPQHQLCVLDGMCEDGLSNSGPEQPRSEMCIRGLEQRLSFERQRNKYIALRAVLEAQKRIRAKSLHSPCSVAQQQEFDPSLHLALIASKCTAWARDVALQAARDDFVETYPSAASEITQPVLTRHATFPPVKRRISETKEEQERRNIKRKSAPSNLSFPSLP